MGKKLSDVILVGAGNKVWVESMKLNGDINEGLSTA